MLSQNLIFNITDSLIKFQINYFNYEATILRLSGDHCYKEYPLKAELETGNLLLA